jgi:hypothetical protein
MRINKIRGAGSRNLKEHKCVGKGACGGLLQRPRAQEAGQELIIERGKEQRKKRK